MHADDLLAVSLGGLLPAAVAALALVMSLRWGGRRSEAVRRVGAAAALGLGYLAGWGALRLSWGDPPLRPTDPWHWLPFLALIAVLTGLHDLSTALERSRLGQAYAALAQFLHAWRADRPGPLAWVVRVVVAAVSAWMLIPAGQELRLAWVVGLGVFILLTWSVLDPLARSWPGPLLPGLLAVVAAEVAALLFLAGSAKFAQLSGVLAAVLAGAAVVAWRVPAVPLLRGMAPGVAVLVPGWLAGGYCAIFSLAPLTCFLLLAVAPLALVVAMPRRRPESIGVTVGRAALALAPGLVALALAWKEAPPY
jgi:hypothetical protein